MADIFDDYESAIRLAESAYQRLKSAEPRHELVTLWDNIGTEAGYAAFEKRFGKPEIKSSQEEFAGILYKAHMMSDYYFEVRSLLGETV